MPDFREHIDARRGFTLLETLVAVGVVVVLISILIPSLRGARLAAKEGAVLAHQRESGAFLTGYVNDNRGRFPYWGTPGTSDAPLVIDGEVWVDGYWSHMLHWANFLVENGYPEASIAQSGPELQYEPEPGTPRYALDWLTATAFARPSYWREEDPQSEADHHVQSWFDIAQPSAKGVLLRYNHVRETEFESRPVFVYFADGHAEKRSPGLLRPGVLLRTVVNPWSRPVLTTENGILGRDI